MLTIIAFENANSKEARGMLLFNTLTNVTLLMTIAGPTSAAERMRRYRERRRDGLCCLRIELRDTEIDALVRKGLLKPETRHDQNAIADALYDYLERNLDPLP